MQSFFHFKNDVLATMIKSPVDEAIPLDLKFMGVGHSYIAGTISGLGTPYNSYRREAYYRFRDVYGLPYDFVGIYDSATDLPNQKHCGVAGQSAAVLNTLIDGYLDTVYPDPTASDCVLLGPVGFWECLNEIPLATFHTSMTGIVNKINAHSSKIKIFIITDPYCPYSFPPGQNINDYADEVESVYNEQKALGRNVFLIDLNSQPVTIGPDNIHPNWKGYAEIGVYIVDQVCSLLNITAITSSILLNDTFTDTNGTLLKNHTSDINLTTDVWHDSNDIWKISNNELIRNGAIISYDANININRQTYTGYIKLKTSATGNLGFMIKSNSTGSDGIFLWLDFTQQKIKLYDAPSSAYDEANFTWSYNTWYTFKIIITGNCIYIYNNDNLLLQTILDASHSTQTYIGFFEYPTGNQYIDDVIIYYTPERNP